MQRPRHRVSFGVSTAAAFSAALTACGTVVGIPDYTFVGDGGPPGASGAAVGPSGAAGSPATGNSGVSGSVSGASGSAGPSGVSGSVGPSGASGSGPSGAVTGTTSGSFTGSTGTTGTASGSSGATGSTSGDTTGASTGSGSSGGATGSASGNSGGTTGSFSGSATGSSTGSTSGGTSGSTSGSATGSTTGSASGSSSGSSGMAGASGTSSGSSGTSTGPAPMCQFGTAYNGNGSFTNYWFGQGTPKNNAGLYQTACGYVGTESGTTDTVQNIANGGSASNTYFAAIPGQNNFDTVNDCGACVEITNGGNKIIATIIDECPTDGGNNPPCKNAGHLDLSKAAFNRLGYSTGDPSGTTWHFVACPITGNIVAVAKSGNSDQVYIENTVFPISSVTFNGGQKASHLSYGVWSLNGTGVSGQRLTLTDIEGHSVTATVPGGYGDLGVQFPSPGTCQ